jgi:hypothetical protein
VWRCTVLEPWYEGFDGSPTRFGRWRRASTRWHYRAVDAAPRRQAAADDVFAAYDTCPHRDIHPPTGCALAGQHCQPMDVGISPTREGLLGRVSDAFSCASNLKEIISASSFLDVGDQVCCIDAYGSGAVALGIDSDIFIDR